MITHLMLRDFQSWRALDLELGPVTMLAGKGNSGKTAIIRALKYALTNQTGDDFIREGATKAEVGFTFDDEALLWVKARGKGGVYQLSSHGSSFTKTGGLVPGAITEATNMHEIVIDKTTALMPNIQMQFDAPFIIGESGSKIARILGRLTKLNILVTAQMACRADADAARGEARTATSSLAQIAQQMDAFPDTTQLHTQCLDLSAESIPLNAQGIALVQARRLLAQRDRAAALRHKTVPRLREDARKLTDKAVALYPVRSLLLRLHAEQAKLADAGLGIDRAGEALAEAKGHYDAACQSAGVCEVCPWR